MDLRRDRFNSTAIFTIVLIAVLAIALNYPYQYVPVETRFWQSNFDFSNLYESAEVSYLSYAEGGFPLTWASDRVNYPSNELHCSWLKLTFNISFWVVTAIIVSFIVARLRQHSFRPWSWSLLRKVARTSEGLLTMGCCLALLLYGSISIAHFLKDMRASRELQRHGVVITYAMLPRPLAPLLPGSIAHLFSRVREVVLWKPNQDLLDRALKTDTLTVLVLLESSLSSEAYDALADLPSFHQLSIRFQPLTAMDLEGMGKVKGLRTLDLRGCTGLADWNGDLPLNQLMHLRITHCDLKLSNLRLDHFKQTLQTAYLSRPRSGIDRLSLNGFSALQRLSLSRMGARDNYDVIEVKLHDLPELEVVSIDLGQLFDLDVINAPHLTAITFEEDRGDSGMRFGDSIATTPMMRRVHLDNVPLLRELEIDGFYLEKIDVQGAELLARLSIGREDFRPSQDTQSRTGVFAARLQQVVNDVGALHGPPIVQFVSMPLGGLDLKSLKKNDRIRSLCFIRCGINDEQATQIAEMPNVHSIDLRGCPVSDQQAMQLLKRDTELQSLLINTRNFENIEIVDQRRLKNFFATEALNAVNVRIKDAPQLTAELLLGSKLGSLSIENARSLVGLSIDGRLPPECELDGLRSLKFFAVGGPEANDKLCRTVWECFELDHLTIAYGSLSRRSLEKVGALKNLTVLSRPGSGLNDDIVRDYWKDLQYLSHVNLSDTKISGLTAQWLCQQKNLQQLAINHCPIDRHSLVSLTNVVQLIELEIAGIGIDVPVLKQCLSKSLIDRLNLSDFPLTPEHVEVLASSAAKNIRFLAIANCGLSDDQVKAIVEENPHLAVDIEGNQVSEETRKWLEQEGRLVNRYDRREFIEFITSGKNSNGLATLATTESIRGRINDYQFASAAQR